MSLWVGDVGSIRRGGLVCQKELQLLVGEWATYSQEAINILSRNSVSTSPDLARLDRLDIEAGDQTEVAATTLQGPEEIGVA